jgi:ATP-dependent Lon protease
MENETNSHNMITRSKKKNLDEEPEKDNKLILEKVDSSGNLMDLIDDSEQSDFDEEMLKKEIERLRGGIKKGSSPKKGKSPTKKIRKKGKKPNIMDLMLPYILMSVLGPQQDVKKKKSRRNRKINIDELLEDKNIEIKIEDMPVEELLEEELPEEGSSEEETSEESLQSEEDIDLDDIDFEEDDEGDEDYEEESESEEELEESSDTEEDEEDEEDFEYDEYDDKFIEIIEDDIHEDQELEYFQDLTPEEKQKHIKELEEIKKINKSNIPLRFKILNSEMDIKTKSIAIENIEKLGEMDVSTGEYCKMDKWINGLIKIPFGKFKDIEITDKNTNEEKREFLYKTYSTLDKAIYGHKEAKMHILQVIGKWIKNPTSQGNVLALQGPMGNGKTTLVKEGIAKAINRPFAFIALGGASDSAFFDGHSYTYEGSHWGRIIDILIDSKCMNPIIYFDELDKVSETFKGEEIIHLLTHLTDPSQNTLFQDNYFPGIHIDLSKSLFIFSFNDESKVDRILKDRMYVINTNGFKPNDKIEICNNYILPELMDTFMFNKEDISFEKEALEYIINKFTENEEGVRNLKRCLETIISKINIYNLSQSESEENKIPLTFKLDNFNIPLNVNKDIVETLLSKKEDNYKPPEHMYM